MYNNQYNYPQGNAWNRSLDQSQQRNYNQAQNNYQAMGYNVPQKSNAQTPNFQRRNNYQGYQTYQNAYNNYSQNNSYTFQQHNNSFNSYNPPKAISKNTNQQLNSSVSYQPNNQQSFNNSFASEKGWNGAPEVGRFGGQKKKIRDLNDSSLSSNSQSKKTTEPKVKQPTIKQESGKEFYFPIHTETTTFVQCPFNSNHMMEPDRLMTHINKCKLKSDNAKFFSVCPYDPCHYFYTTEIEAHILVCDKRSLFVVGDWSQEANSSTAHSTPSQSENEVLEESMKAPTSKLTDQKKSQYEDFFLKDV